MSLVDIGRVGSVFVVDVTGFAGPWERDRVIFQEGVVVRVSSLGINVFESPCVIDRSVIRRVSVADASLSLSLSLVEPV
jgi:hypothetical protein